jgi:hypothetical protein
MNVLYTCFLVTGLLYDTQESKLAATFFVSLSVCSYAGLHSKPDTVLNQITLILPVDSKLSRTLEAGISQEQGDYVRFVRLRVVHYFVRLSTENEKLTLLHRNSNFNISTHFYKTPQYLT